MILETGPSGTSSDEVGVGVVPCLASPADWEWSGGMLLGGDPMLWLWQYSVTCFSRVRRASLSFTSSVEPSRVGM